MWLLVGAAATAQFALLAGSWGALAGPAVSSMCAGVLWFALIRRPLVETAAWRWVAVFMTCTAIADNYLAVFTWSWLREPPVVGGADVFYLAGIAALLIGLLLLLRRVPQDVDALLDMGTAATVGLFLAFQMVIAPTLSDATLSWRDRLVVVAYPVLDVALLALLVGIVANGLRARWVILLVGGLGCWLLADSAFMVLSQTNHLTTATTVTLNVGWAIGDVLFAVAALHPSATHRMHAHSNEGHVLGVRRLSVAMGLFLVPGVTDVMYGRLTGREPNWLAVLLATVVLGALAIARSIRLLHARDAAEAQIRQRERYYRALATDSSEGTVVLDSTGRVTDMVGLIPGVFDPALSTSPELVWELIHPADLEEARGMFERAVLRPGHRLETEFRVRRTDGSWMWLLGRAINLTRVPEVGGIVVNLSDVTRRKLAEEELTHQAFHDALTGLPNRALFRDRLEHAVRRTARRARSLAVVYLDLDSFKTVNDSLGHDAGDQLLRAVAGQIAGVVRSGDTVARLGGDEFAIVLEEGTDVEDEAIALAQRVLQQLSDPIKIDGHFLTVRASIGIAIGDLGIDGGALLRNADIAMYQAKAAGKGQAVIYQPKMQTAVTERLQLESELFGALDRHELSVVYQPVVELGTNGVVGFEALLRWEHPILGTIMPERFVPIAEDNGAIVDIGAWVLDTACAAAAEWAVRYPHSPPLGMAVNLSGRELADPGLLGRVRRTIATTGIEPHSLILEITETVLIEDTDRVANRLDELRELGIRIAIDDFGTGYSSMSYLGQFHVDILKIDRSFVNAIRNHEQIPALLRGLLDLGNTLELETIAEGVEHDYEREQLLDNDCELAQGFLFSKPLTRGDAEQYLDHHADSVIPTHEHL